MDDLTYIREKLKKFEKNIDEEKGVDSLGDALSCICEILDYSNDKHERNIASNIMRTYRDRVIGKARALFSTGTPNSGQLIHIDKLMEVFVDSGFGDDLDFSTLKSEIRSRHIDEFLREVRGKYPKDFDENDKLWFKSLLADLL